MISKNQKLLIKDIKDQGYAYKDIDDLFNQKELPLDVINTILKWLPLVYKDHIGSGDHLCRALIASKDPFDPQPLIDFFKASNYHETVMWVIGYVLSVAKTFDISLWIKNELFEEPYSIQRSSLLIGLVNKGSITSVEELMEILKKLFTKYSVDVTMIKLIMLFGRKSDISFLEQEKLKADNRLSKEIDKAIVKIKTRKRVNVFPVKKVFEG